MPPVCPLKCEQLVTSGSYDSGTVTVTLKFIVNGTELLLVRVYNVVRLVPVNRP